MKLRPLKGEAVAPDSSRVWNKSPRLGDVVGSVGGKLISILGWRASAAVSGSPRPPRKEWQGRGQTGAAESQGWGGGTEFKFRGDLCPQTMGGHQTLTSLHYKHPNVNHDLRNDAETKFKQNFILDFIQKHCFHFTVNTVYELKILLFHST